MCPESVEILCLCGSSGAGRNCEGIIIITGSPTPFLDATLARGARSGKEESSRFPLLPDRTRGTGKRNERKRKKGENQNNGRKKRDGTILSREFVKTLGVLARRLGVQLFVYLRGGHSRKETKEERRKRKKKKKNRERTLRTTPSYRVRHTITRISSITVTLL